MVAVPLLLTKILISSSIILNLSVAQTLYERCGEENVVCVGVRDGVTNLDRGGCIRDKDCYVFLSIYRNSTSNHYDWTLAIMTRDSRNPDEHGPNDLHLFISKSKVEMLRDKIPPPNIPFWLYRDYQLGAWIRICNNDVAICSEEEKNDHPLNPGILSFFVTFDGMIAKSFEHDSRKLNYDVSLGKSKQELSIKYLSHRFKCDLINDELTIALFHSYESGIGTPEPKLKRNNGGNFQPKQLFKLPEVGTREPAHQPQKKSMLWLWIVIGVVGTLILIALCILIYCCCCRGKKNSKSKSRDGNNEPVPMSEAQTKTVGNTTTSSKNSTINEPKKTSSKRLNYIAQLAGYTPGKPLSGPKKTGVKKHDFTKTFNSESVVVKKNKE